MVDKPWENFTFGANYGTISNGTIMPDRDINIVVIFQNSDERLISATICVERIRGCERDKQHSFCFGGPHVLSVN